MFYKLQTSSQFGGDSISQNIDYEMKMMRAASSAGWTIN
jgi:hypothetical protein